MDPSKSNLPSLLKDAVFSKFSDPDQREEVLQFFSNCPQRVLTELVEQCGSLETFLNMMTDQYFPHLKPKWDGKGADGKVVSQVRLCGDQNGKCGYCDNKKKGGRASYGVINPVLTCSDYQDMIDRGWRRSGDYCYKPANNVACCPNYTIRLNVEKFVASKSQKKVYRRFENYLNGSYSTSSKKKNRKILKQKALEDPIAQKLRHAISESIRFCISNELLPSSLGDTFEEQLRVTQRKQKRKQKKSSMTDYTTSIALILGSHFKKQNSDNSENSLSSSAIADVIVANLPIKDWLPNIGKPGFINFPSDAMPEEYRNLEIQEESDKMCIDDMKEEDGVEKHTLTMELLPSRFRKEAFEVYKKYQMKVHRDKESDCTEGQYTRFLCDTPLVPENCDAYEFGYGSYHQYYRIDGKLVCVGVIDVLPKCLSSVYLFYDPDYSFLSLGVVSALKEIEFVKQRAGFGDQFRYYYMGYYIHDCTKMKYKGAYHPSELLCPEKYSWHTLDLCRTALDSNSYVVFSKICEPVLSSSSSAPSEDDESKRTGSDEEVLGEIKLLVSNDIVLFKDTTKRSRQHTEKYLESWLVHIGADLAMKFVNTTWSK